MSKDKKKKSKNSKQGAKQGKSGASRGLRKPTMAKVAGALIVVSGLVGAALSGAVEHLIPVDPVADKALGFTDAIKVDEVHFDNVWPMAFDDPGKAEAYARLINSDPQAVSRALPTGVSPRSRIPARSFISAETASRPSA